eukprot:scaffold107116_cov17-Tisochrysis_lutea.AAC.1
MGAEAHLLWPGATRRHPARSLERDVTLPLLRPNGTWRPPAISLEMDATLPLSQEGRRGLACFKAKLWLSVEPSQCLPNIQGVQ